MPNNWEMDEAAEEARDMPPVPEFGVVIGQLSDGTLTVEMVGEPSYGQCLRLLAEAQANIQAEITAQRVLTLLADTKKKQRITTDLRMPQVERET
jgi:hypothetical protein